MPEPRDECRPVLLPSGETVRVRGAEPMGPEAVAALGEVVAAARARMAAEHPPNPAAEGLWARLWAVADARDIRLRDAAHEAGVRPWTVLRIAQGIMPGDGDMAAIERWLTEGETNARGRTDSARRDSDRPVLPVPAAQTEAAVRPEAGLRVRASRLVPHGRQGVVRVEG